MNGTRDEKRDKKIEGHCLLKQKWSRSGLIDLVKKNLC